MFRRILIANRGEIAVRIIRACRELGIATVAVYSEADRQALHVRMADQAVAIGPAPAPESYLVAERIIAAALTTGAEAIHPGYGFLSERVPMARACQAAGLTFIGPPPEAIALLGDKIAAKRLAAQVGVPMVAGFLAEQQTHDELVHGAEQVGFPLMIKAAAGGGGRGMRIVRSLDGFLPALEAAQREARAAFGDEAVFLERLVERPRHVEIQVLADSHGNVVHLFERECSIQRRHQKILEEAPCVALDAAMREQIGAAAVSLARAAGYVNAGTVEFLLDDQGRFSFLEMNTRLQVEHPVTELITGLDLVQLQIRIAAGEALPFGQADLKIQGHAIEVRLCAEDPVSFLPSSGELALFAAPAGPGIRCDAGVQTGDSVTVYYDSLLAKLIVHAQNRPAALARMRQALDETMLLGVVTNLPLLRTIITHPDLLAGMTSTAFLDGVTLPDSAAEPTALVLAVAAILDARSHEPLVQNPWIAGAWRAGGAAARYGYELPEREAVVWLQGRNGQYQADVDGQQVNLTIVSHTPHELVVRVDDQQRQFQIAHEEQTWLIGHAGQQYRMQRSTGLSLDKGHGHQRDGTHASLTAPMPGTVVRVLASEGAHVEAQQPLVVLEAMKMEHIVAAPYDGIVQRVYVSQGALVARGAELVEIEAGV